jgi:O-antigen/teichoic acid export membrane protein
MTLARTLRTFRYLRGRPFDVATPDGRSQERYRRAAWATLAGLGARAIALLVTLVTIPLAIGYLGPEQYGVWATISAFSAMLIFADFGLGNGLMNVVAGAYGRGDRAAAQGAISSAFVMLMGVAGLLTLVFAFTFPIVPWPQLANVTSEDAAAQVAPAVLAYFACFAIGLPLGLVQRLQYGYQEGYEVGAWAALGSVLSLVGLVIAIRVEATLPWLVLALAGGPVVALAGNAIVVFAKRHPDLRPAIGLATKRAAANLVRVGLLFFVLQLAVAVAFQSDVIVAAQILGSEAAAEYSVVARLFLLTPSLLWMAFLPLWPAYGEAVARGDVPWLRRTVMRSTLAGIAISGASSAVLLVVGNQVLRFWLGPVFDPPFALMLGMAVWAVLSTAGTSMAMLLNGATVIGFQVVVAITMATTSIVASIVLGQLFGLSGVIWGTVLAYVVCNAVPIVWYVPRLLHRLERERGDA